MIEENKETKTIVENKVDDSDIGKLLDLLHKKINLVLKLWVFHQTFSTLTRKLKYHPKKGT